MRKSTLFISATLTTFMLAIMFGVVSAYQKIVQTGVPTENTQQAQPANVMVGTSSTIAGAVTIEQAAALASQVIGRTDLYAAENSLLDGVNTYLVTFSSGDIVYVSLDGKILSISKLPVTYIAASNWVGSGGNGGGSSTVSPSVPSTSNNNGSEGGDDHDDDDEEHDD